MNKIIAVLMVIGLTVLVYAGTKEYKAVNAEDTAFNTDGYLGAAYVYDGANHGKLRGIMPLGSSDSLAECKVKVKTFLADNPPPEGFTVVLACGGMDTVN